jgi:CBS domain containing-hemolysin-like protein
LPEIARGLIESQLVIGLRLLGVLALLAINGFFSAAEFALVAVRLSRVRQLVEQGNARARIVQDLLGQLDRVVSGVQVGMTFTSLGLGALGEPALAQLFRPVFAWLPGGAGAIFAHIAAITLAFALLSVLHVVFGEVVPKMLSLERAARAALVIARPFSWYLHTFRWAIDLLDGFSRRVVRALGITSRASAHTLAHTSEELQIQISQARERGLLAPGEEHFILGVLDLGQLRVREIMVPRPDVHALSVEAGLDETLTVFATTQRSRLPVYQSTLDTVLGFVHIKDILWVLLDRERRAEQGATMPPFDLRRLLRDVLIVPESKLAGELLAEMRLRRITVAMVVDEFGSILGLLTLEDILEQLIGEIHDEFDAVPAPQIIGTGPGAAIVFDGAIGLRDLESQYNIRLPEDPAYSTLGGFVLARLGAIPRGGECFDYGAYRFTVTAMDRRRVARVNIQRLVKPSETPVATSPESSAPVVKTAPTPTAQE